MSWLTPKTDWTVNPKAPGPADFNRIEGNIDFLKTDIETKKGAIVDALDDVGVDVELTDTHAQIAAKILAANQGTKIITPSTVNQTIPKGFHSGQGYVEGDADLKAANIRKGVNIFGVPGSMMDIPWFYTWDNSWSTSSVYWDVFEIPRSATVQISAPVGEPRRIVNLMPYSMVSMYVKMNIEDATSRDIETGVLVQTGWRWAVLEGSKLTFTMSHNWSNTQLVYLNTIRLQEVVWAKKLVAEQNFFAPAGKEYLVLGLCLPSLYDDVFHTDGTNVSVAMNPQTILCPMKTWVTNTFGLRAGSTSFAWGIEKPDNITPLYGMVSPGAVIKPPTNKRWLLWHNYGRLKKISTGETYTNRQTYNDVILDGTGDHGLWWAENDWGAYAGVEL